MTSNHSSYDENTNKISRTAYFKQSIKQHYAAIALIILTYCAMPLFQMFVAIDQAKYQFQRIFERTGVIDAVNISNVMDNYILYVLTLDNGTMKTALVTQGILVACIVFRYLHSKKQTDFYHCLPIKRSTLFWNQYLLGILLILPMYFIAYGTSFLYADIAMQEFGGITGLTGKEILITHIANVLIFLLSYTTSVIANILVGNTIIGLLLSGLLLVCFDWIVMTKNLLIYGFMSQVAVQYTQFSLTEMSPLLNLLSLRSYDLDFNYFGDVSDERIFTYSNASDYVTMNQLNVGFVLYAILVIVLTAVAYYLFAKRPSETAGNCMSFKVSKPIFKYLGVVLVSISAGLLFYETFRSSVVAMYGGMALFVVLFHCTVEIIYDFDVKSIFKNSKSIIGCFIVAAGIVCMFQYDVFSMDKKIPKSSSVESVELSDWSNRNYVDTLPGIRMDWLNTALPIEDPDFIDSVINLHTLANEEDYQEAIEQPFSFSIYIEYNLTNGGLIGRNIAVTKELVDTLSAIVNTDLYAEQHVAFFSDYYTDIRFTEIYALNQKMHEGVLKQTPKEPNPVIDEFTEALLVDIKAHGLCPSDDIMYQISGQAYYDTIFDIDTTIVEREAMPEVVEYTSTGEVWKYNNTRQVKPFYIYKEYTNAIAVLEKNIEFTPIFTYENQEVFYPYFLVRSMVGNEPYFNYYYFNDNEVVLSAEEVEMIYESGLLFFDSYDRSNFHEENGIALSFDSGHREKYVASGYYDYNMALWLDEEAVIYFDEMYDLF